MLKNEVTNMINNQKMLDNMVFTIFQKKFNQLQNLL